MSRALILCVFLLVFWQDTKPHPINLIEGPANKFSSSIKNEDEGLAKLFDEILLQVLSKGPYDAPFEDARTADKLLALKDMEEGFPQPKNLTNSEFVSSSDLEEENLAKLFDEILLQVLSKTPYDVPFEEARTTGKSMTKREVNEGVSNAWNSEPDYFLGTADRIADNDHISEERRIKEPSLFHRDVNNQLATVTSGTAEGAVSPDSRNGNMPCAQLLHFLRKNIIITAFSVAAILAVTVMLLLMLTSYVRSRQPLYPPANMTYNIFIMNGKTWWQKSPDKNLRKFSGKQKLLKSNSCV